MELIDRRNFIKSTAAVGAGIFLAPQSYGAEDGGKDVIHVAFIGLGEQGRTLLIRVLELGKNSGVRIVAVCDIWEKGNLLWASNLVKKYRAYGHVGTPYVDYREMLDKEKDLDAVIIASPDFWHSEHTVACLEKGLHVYCEKEMSNTIEGAKKMVEAAAKTGRLLQIGHQRRSNPRYIFSFEKVISEMEILGRITTVNGQWNRSKSACQEITSTVPDTAIDEATLNKYGYKSMKQFLNWRWYKGLGGGPIVDLGSHQIDIYNWFLKAAPKSVMASGGTDYWKGRDWYDNVMAVYEYQTPQGIVRAFYQTITTNSCNGFFESFLGENGTLLISESPATRNSVYREEHVPEEQWDKWVSKKYLIKAFGLEKPAVQAEQDTEVKDARVSPTPPKYDMNIVANEPPHRFHLVNFFEAIRGKAKLNCPADKAYETAVTVLKVNEAVETGKKIEFKPEDFKV